MTRIFIIILLVLDSSIRLCSQIPVTEHYSALEYGQSPRNWSMTKSGDGLLYIGNSDGLLEYDGSKWRLIRVPGNTVRVVCSNDNGEVYVGSINNFGLLQKNYLGTIEYISLSDSLPVQDQPQTVWNSSCIGEKIYFQTRDKIYVYRDTSLLHIIHSDDFTWSFSDGEQYYALTNDGLSIVKEGKLISLPDFGTNYFNSSIFGLERHQEDELLIFTRDYGPLIYSQRKESFTELDETGKLAEWCKKHRFYGAKKILLDQQRNGSIKSAVFYVLISSDNGAIVINDVGKIIYELSTETGCHSNNINSIYFDTEQQNLWLITYNGLQKLNLGYPVDKFGFHQNISSRIHTIHKHKNKIYVGADNGLMVKDETANEFNQIKGTQSQCWNMMTLDNKLYVAGGNNGLYIIENNKLTGQYYTQSALFKILPINNNPELLLGATYNGIVVFQKDDTNYQVIGTIPKTEGKDCRYMIEKQFNEFWIGTTTDGFIQLQLPKEINATNIIKETIVSEYKKHSGLVSTENCKLFNISGQLLFTSKNGIYTLNEKKSVFERYNPFHLDLDADQFNRISLFEDHDKNIWIPESKLIIDSKNNVNRESLNMIPIPATVIFQEKDNVVWIGTDNGLYRYGYDISLPNYKFKTLIRKVQLESTDSIIANGIFTNHTLNSILPYAMNSIAFRFTSNEFANEKNVSFRYKLEGSNENWSEWTPNRYKDYNRLKEGAYTFHVQAKNKFGRIGEKASYSFSIASPWYRTSSAYVAYVFGGILLIFISIRISIHRLKVAKVRLEKLVKDRTHEIVEKNREITDSIKYAKRIQNAILPPPKLVKEYIPDSFILYKPKDVVAGDFYWMEQKKDTILFAAADCTGHGVPGAMVSVICNNGLNRSVREYGLEDPGEILYKTREIIIQEFEKSEEDVKDGMDISLCSLQTKDSTFKLSWSGANNPLWIIRNGELLVTKPNKQAIGKVDNPKPFTTHEVKIQKGDTIYIFTDGFQDQFGGQRGKKFKRANLKNLLISINPKSMLEQRELLDKAFEDWKGDLEQVDDVCVIGVRV